MGRCAIRTSEFDSRPFAELAEPLTMGNISVIRLRNPVWPRLPVRAIDRDLPQVSKVRVGCRRVHVQAEHPIGVSQAEAEAILERLTINMSSQVQFGRKNWVSRNDYKQ